MGLQWDLNKNSAIGINILIRLDDIYIGHINTVQTLCWLKVARMLLCGYWWV